MLAQRLRRARWAVVAAAAFGLASGCAVVNPGLRRAATVAGGTAAGAGAGYLLSDGSSAATVAGAIAGAGLTHLGLGADPDVRQEGFDAGYVQGQSDAIKREYFLRQAKEAEPPASTATAGEAVYYVMPGPEVTADGRKLEPHQVAVRVVE
jgi:hypothetical protein